MLTLMVLGPKSMGLGIRVIRLWSSRTSLIGALHFNNGWQRPMFTYWNEAQKSNGDREYCLTDDDKTHNSLWTTGGSPAIFRTVVELSELVGSEQPHLSLMPVIITEVKHTTKSVKGESESVASLEVLIQQRIPHHDDRCSSNCNTCRPFWATWEIWFSCLTHG